MNCAVRVQFWPPMRTGASTRGSAGSPSQAVQRLAGPLPRPAPGRRHINFAGTRLTTEAEGGAVALGADLPIGLPRAYAATRPEADFPTFFAMPADLPDFFCVCATLDDIRPDRPFYPARGIAGMTRLSHALGLGLPDILLYPEPATAPRRNGLPGRRCSGRLGRTSPARPPLPHGNP